MWSVSHVLFIWGLSISFNRASHSYARGGRDREGSRPTQYWLPPGESNEVSADPDSADSIARMPESLEDMYDLPRQRPSSADIEAPQSELTDYVNRHSRRPDDHRRRDELMRGRDRRSPPMADLIDEEIKSAISELYEEERQGRRPDVSPPRDRPREPRPEEQMELADMYHDDSARPSEVVRRRRSPRTVNVQEEMLESPYDAEEQKVIVEPPTDAPIIESEETPLPAHPKNISSHHVNLTQSVNPASAMRSSNSTIVSNISTTGQPSDNDSAGFTTRSLQIYTTSPENPTESKKLAAESKGGQSMPFSQTSSLLIIVTSAVIILR